MHSSLALGPAYLVWSWSESPSVVPTPAGLRQMFFLCLTKSVDPNQQRLPKAQGSAPEVSSLPQPLLPEVLPLPLGCVLRGLTSSPPIPRGLTPAPCRFPLASGMSHCSSTAQTEWPPLWGSAGQGGRTHLTAAFPKHPHLFPQA